MSITSNIFNKRPTTSSIKQQDVLGVKPYLPKDPTFTQQPKTLQERLSRLGGAQEETSPVSPRLERAEAPSPLDVVREDMRNAPKTNYAERIKQEKDRILSPSSQRRVDRLQPLQEQANLKRQFDVAETKASKERVSSAKEELKIVQRELEPLQRMRTEQMTPVQIDRRKELIQRVADLAGTSNPYAVAVFKELVPGFSKLMEDNTRRAGITPTRGLVEQAQAEKGFKAGEITTKIGKQVTIYKAASALVNGVPALANLGSKVFGKLGEEGAKFATGQATDLLIDNLVQTPVKVFNAIKNDTSIDEVKKDLFYQNLLDLGINLGIGGLGEVFKNLKNADTGAVKQVDDAIDATKQVDEVAQQVKQVEPPVQQPTRAFAEGDIPEFGDVTIQAGTKELKDIPSVNTESIVLTEMPKRAKNDATDFIDRTYQELVSKNAPFEKIGKLTKNETLTAKAGNLNRTTGTIDYNISKAQSDMSGKDIGLSMQDIFKDVPENQKLQLYDYALNKHNIARSAEGKPVFGDIADSIDSSTKVAKLDISNPELKETQQNITKYFDNLISEWGVKSGMVSQDTRSYLKDLYPDYVPTYRAIDIDRAMGGGDGNFVSQILKKAKGSEKQILPLDQQMAMLTDRTIRNARKNEVMLTLDDVFTENPDAVSRYIKGITDVEAKPITDLLDIGGELEKPVLKKGSDYVINYYKDGVPKQMTVNETLYNAMKTMEQDTMDKVLGVVRNYATNPFKSLITTYNPLFAVSNIMRDVPTALMYAKNPLKLIGNVPEATKQMLTNGDLWKQYQAMGGTRSGLFNYEKGVNLDFAKTKTLGSKLKSGAKKTGEAFESINNFTETLPRFSEFVTSMKETNNPALSLMRSAELTTDFARFGKQTKRADAVVPYLNASVQGIDKFARQLRDKPLQTIARGGVVVATPTLILDQVNKNNPDYNNMSARERNQYYHIPKDDGTFWRIPRAREVGVLFGTVFEWMARAARGEEVTADEIMSVASENFTPVNGFDSNILKPAGNFWKIATGKDPDAKNYFGSKIVSTGLQKYSPSQQYDENTTSIAKNLGEFLDVSPKAIDYLMDSYLGVIGDTAMPYLTDKKVDHLAPLKRKFIADPVFKSESQNKFYDILDSTRKKANDFNQQNDIPSKIVTPLEKQASMLNKFSSQLSKLRDQQKTAQNAGDEVKSKQLREQMNEISNKAIESTLSEEELQIKLNELLKVLNRK